MAEEETPSEDVVPQSGGKMKMMIFGAVGLVLVVVGVFAGPAIRNMISPPEEVADVADSEEVVVTEPPIYQSLHPPLIVNFNDAAGDAHFMQITLEVMSRDQESINSLRDNTAVIRNALILLYSSSVFEEIQMREGKEQMLADGLAEIQRVMLETTGTSDIEAVYFTALVIQ